MKDLSLQKKYDLIYGHWSLGYLLDEDLSEFLIRCRASLLKTDKSKNGLMIVKETIAQNEGLYDGPVGEQ